jgi:hypothetical protein
MSATVPAPHACHALGAAQRSRCPVFAKVSTLEIVTPAERGGSNLEPFEATLFLMKKNLTLE